MNHFKTQQEIWKYVADGGAVIHKNAIIPVKFNYGKIALEFCCPEDWSPYIEPVAKTKVWRWEKRTPDFKWTHLTQTKDLHCEEYATKFLPSYTKVEGSEREI